MQVVRSLSNLFFKPAYFISRIPAFSAEPSSSTRTIKVISSEQSSSLPEKKSKEFTSDKTTTITKIQGEKETSETFYNETSWKKIQQISKDTNIVISESIQKQNNFLGIASEILKRGYKFSRKQKDQKSINLSLNSSQTDYIFALTKSKIQAAEWANSRGNEANTTFMLQQAQEVAKKHPNLKLSTIQGDALLDQGFRLMHAVGRGSANPPIFVCLEWKGQPENDDFVALVGKGVTFDAGGLNLKPSTGISGMHNDKHGACSVLSAIDTIASLNLKQNVVAVLGLVQNFISSNSYRPLDIIKSRKGLTVQIGNTDAEGRLVLADCMNWVQEKYKVKTMLQLSTLTGAIIIGLGKERAGFFSNSKELVNQLSTVGEQIQELGWHMPIDQEHHQLIKSKQADITNASKKPEGSSSQAAAFLEKFVEKGVNWAHIDIAGVAEKDTYSTGFGAKLLIHLLKKRAQ